jgi:hypothetical protein
MNGSPKGGSREERRDAMHPWIDRCGSSVSVLNLLAVPGWLERIFLIYAIGDLPEPDPGDVTDFADSLWSQDIDPHDLRMVPRRLAVLSRPARSRGDRIDHDEVRDLIPSEDGVLDRRFLDRVECVAREVRESIGCGGHPQTGRLGLFVGSQERLVQRDEFLFGSSAESVSAFGLWETAEVVQ